MRTVLIFGVVALAGTGRLWAAAPALEDLDALDRRIAVSLGGTAADVGQAAVAIDRRLRLLRCPEGAVLAPPAMGAIAVTCPSRGWRFHVRLVAAAAPVAETVIRRGDAVALTYAGRGFDVTTTATALEDGRTGQVVRVKTLTGAAPLIARVLGPGAAAIGD